ncbi:MAG: hypothetical protein QM708_08255 [Propioniciclava sp.]|uniref:5-oxoprolinase subunit C family protein n=1 Tax=Propioniciclava sp. TaxID=2038686 RepID=UPI0039E32817
MNPLLTLTQAGVASVTDLGRYGVAHLGIQTNGALDQPAARAANILVGNPDSAPVIEVTTIVPFAFRTSEAVLLAVTGAAGSVTLDGDPVATHAPLLTWPNAEVKISPAPSGLRAYVAVHGRIQGDEFLGSVARDPLIGRGRRLSTGDVVIAHGARLGLVPHPPLFLVAAPREAYPHEWVLDVLPGPELAEFPGFTGGITSTAYTVDTRSDHVGIRLAGPGFERVTSSEILSRGVPLGAVEIPPTGGPIILMRGRPLTAGYPIPAVVARSCHHYLGQMRPGDTLRLRMSTAEQSIRAVRQQEADLAALRHRCRTMYEASHLFTDTPVVPIPR